MTEPHKAFLLNHGRGDGNHDRAAFRHLPVMQNDRLSGIVSIGDLVNYRIHQTEREAEALKSYIRGG